MALQSKLNELFSALQSTPEPVVVLNEISDVASVPGASQTLQNTKSIPLQFMFGLLNTTDQDQIVACCNALDKIFSLLSVEVFREYGNFVELGLQHPSVTVKLLCLKFVGRCAEVESQYDFVLAPTMFHLVVQLLGHSDVNCAMETCRVIHQLSANPSSLEIMFAKRKGSLVGDLDQILLGNEAVRFRVYELMFNIAVASSQTFDLVSSTGIFLKLIKELDQDDVLVQLNGVEMLTRFVQSHDGAQFLEQQQVVQKLHTKLTSVQQDFLSNLLIPGKFIYLLVSFVHTVSIGIFKFFVHLVMQDQVDVTTICKQCPAFMDVVYSTMEQVDNNLWSSAVQTFAALGSTLHSRQALLYNVSKTMKVLGKLGTLIAESPSEVRIIGMDAVSTLIACPEGGVRDAVLVSSYETFYSSLGEDFASTLYSVGKQPFSDLRCAMLKLLASVVTWKWGQERIKKVPGFIEFLLDRSTEVDKEAKELRYDAIHTMASSDTAEVVLGALTYRRIKEYDLEGPFHVQSENIVAMEEA